MPSKFWIGPDMGAVPPVFGTTGSFVPAGEAAGFSDSISRARSGELGTGSTGSELTAGEVPWKSPSITCGPKVESFVVAAATDDIPLPSALARAIPANCVAYFAVVPEPELPATATRAAARTTGSEATTTVLRRRLTRTAARAMSFRTICHPRDDFLCVATAHVTPAPSEPLYREMQR